MARVFVYGTLRKNEPNCNIMEGSTFIGNATTCEKYPLVIASSFYIPFLLNLPGNGHHVMGEVYEVTAEKLQELDRLERVPILYDRQLIQVTTSENDVSGGESIQDVNAYILNAFKEDLLEKEMISDYSLDCADRASYVHAKERAGGKEEILATVFEAVKAK